MGAIHSCLSTQKTHPPMPQKALLPPPRQQTQLPRLAMSSFLFLIPKKVLLPPPTPSLLFLTPQKALLLPPTLSLLSLTLLFLTLSLLCLTLLFLTLSLP